MNNKSKILISSIIVIAMGAYAISSFKNNFTKTGHAENLTNNIVFNETTNHMTESNRSEHVETFSTSLGNSIKFKLFEVSTWMGGGFNIMKTGTFENIDPLHGLLSLDIAINSAYDVLKYQCSSDGLSWNEYELVSFVSDGTSFRKANIKFDTGYNYVRLFNDGTSSCAINLTISYSCN